MGYECIRAMNAHVNRYRYRRVFVPSATIDTSSLRVYDKKIFGTPMTMLHILREDPNDCFIGYEFDNIIIIEKDEEKMREIYNDKVIYRCIPPFIKRHL